MKNHSIDIDGWWLSDILVMENQKILTLRGFDFSEDFLFPKKLKTLIPPAHTIFIFNHQKASKWIQEIKKWMILSCRQLFNISNGGQFLLILFFLLTSRISNSFLDSKSSTQYHCYTTVAIKLCEHRKKHEVVYGGRENCETFSRPHFPLNIAQGEGERGKILKH